MSTQIIERGQDSFFDPIHYEKKEITMLTTPRTNNTLSHADVYKLTRWIELNQATLKGKTQEQISQTAGEATGLKVTVSNVRAVSETLGIPLGLYTRTQSNVIPNDINRALARALCDLYKRLGEEVPGAVNAIAHR